jgi:DNA mismatch endonuclease, patch repair protein
MAIMAQAHGKTGMRAQALEIPGRPDFVFDDSKVAVFAQGCFWHGCPTHWQLPLSKPDFWRRKMLKARRRDLYVDETLEDLGWRVIRVWECQDFFVAAARVLFVVRARQGYAKHGRALLEPGQED